MAKDMHQVNVKVPTECHRVLFALARASGDEISLVARRALIEFTKKQLHLATMVVRVSRSELSAAGDEIEADVSGYPGISGSDE